MRRIAVLICLVLCLSLMISGCGQPSGEAMKMYIEKAELSEEEKDLLRLIGHDAVFPIYDFVVDDSVKSIQVNTYEIVDGERKLVNGGGGYAFEKERGRLALVFDFVPESLRVSIQSGDSYTSTMYESDTGDLLDGMGCCTSLRTDKTEIVYEQEIPLVMEIHTAQNSVHSVLPDNMDEMMDVLRYDYEYVYAITVRFSQKTVAELDRDIH